jgi:hypothetical protein
MEIPEMQASPTIDQSNNPHNPDLFDIQIAEREGWTVTNLAADERADGVPRQIGCFKSSDHASPIFLTDRAAWLHVVEQARTGSALHRAALRLIDPIERLAIENVCGGW